MLLQTISMGLLGLLQDPAGSAGEAEPAGLFANPLVPLVAMVAIFWFVMIAPERKQRKKRQSMLDALKKGDKVMTSGGLYGTVTQVHEGRVTLQASDNVRLTFSRAAIQDVIHADAPKGKDGETGKNPETQKAD